MNMKHWMMALVIALAGTAVATAQEGVSTMEGVPVVEELVTDEVAPDDTASTSVTATARVGSWHITAYSDDSLMTHKTIELTEEMMDEFFDDMPGLFKGLLGLSGIGLTDYPGGKSSVLPSPEFLQCFLAVSYLTNRRQCLIP